MKSRKPLRRNGLAVTGIIRSNSLAPTRSWGEVERASNLRSGTLKRLYALGEIEATVHPQGGLFFTHAQEVAAIRKCSELDLYID